MLENQMWFEPQEALRIAWHQAMDEGRDVEMDRKVMEETAMLPRGNKEKKRRALELIDRWEKAPMRENYQWREPDELEQILAERDKGSETDFTQGRDKYQGTENGKTGIPFQWEKVYAAWLLRAAGCLLGQPVEGWYRARIEGLLLETDNVPVKHYISSEISDPIRKKYGVEDEKQVYGSQRVNWINNTDGMPEDDDTNYTILALQLMEMKGFDFTADDVGECWLGNLPILHVCTAERVAYINMINGFAPPASAFHRNAYREYIGAQIRGDFFGYVCPGEPERAACLAFRDASVSHVKNGIYGEMFVAAMLAEAAGESNMEKIIYAGISQIPERSRLHDGIAQVVNWYHNGETAEEVIERIHNKYDETFGYDWCHVIPNAMIVCAGLLFGRGDFAKTMDICLRAAFDTDCNCATAGSVIGMAEGIKEEDRRWIEPLKDKIKSGVDGMGCVAISELADRTEQVYRKKYGGRREKKDKICQRQ